VEAPIVVFMNPFFKTEDTPNSMSSVGIPYAVIRGNTPPHSTFLDGDPLLVATN